MFAADRHARMRYRRCGSSGLQLPEISLGFWQSLGAAGNDDLCREVMFRAFDAGVTHFDFANNYGPPPGSAEEIAGRILREMPRDELVISTKAGFRMGEGPYQDGGSRKYLLSSLDASLRRLQLDYVDIYYHHCFDPNSPLEETLGALHDAVRHGKALYVGLSNYDGAQFATAADIITRERWTMPILVQPHYNMLTRVHREGLLPEAARRGTGVIPYCPLAQGALTGKYLGGLPADSRRGRQGADGERWYEEKRREGWWERVSALQDIAARRGMTLPQLALAWLLADERITSVLMGVSRVAQLEENLATLAQEPLSAAELLGIEEILRER